MLFFGLFQLRSSRFSLANFCTTVRHRSPEAPLTDFSPYGNDLLPGSGLRSAQGGCFGKLFATISTHHIDFWMLFEPGFDRRAFSISKHINDFSSLKIDENGSIAKALLPGKIIDPKNPNRS